MCVDGSCGHFTKPVEESEGFKQFQDALTETAEGIAARLPESLGPNRFIIAAIMTAQMAHEAFDEVKAEREARDNREMVSADLGMVA